MGKERNLRWSNNGNSKMKQCVWRSILNKIKQKREGFYNTLVEECRLVTP